MPFTISAVFFFICFSQGKPFCSQPVPGGLVVRSVSGRQTAPLFQETFDLTADFAPQETFFELDSGLTVKCFNCKQTGSFDLTGNFDIDNALLDQFTSVVAGSASSVVAEVTSAAGGIASKATSIAVSVAAQVTSAAGPIASEIASEITSAAAPLVSKATKAAGSIASKVAHGLGDLFGRDAAPVKRGVASDILRKILQGINIQLTQKQAITSDFTINIATGDATVNMAFPDPTFSGLRALLNPSQGQTTNRSRILSLPIASSGFELRLLLQPLAVRVSASLAPRLNLTIPFGANLSLSKPLQLSMSSVTGIPPDLRPRGGAISVNQLNISFCFDIAIGPAIGVTLRHVSSNSEASITAMLDLPRVSVCIDAGPDGRSTCAARSSNPSPQNQKHFNATLEAGLNLESDFTLLGIPLPLDGLGMLDTSALRKNITVADQCFV